MPSAAIQTLGCKLNQLESESIAEAFGRAGFSVEAGPPADLLVINTCSVTSKSEQKARRLIRKALKDHPESCVIVTGCYAQLEAAAIATLEEPDSGLRRLFVLSGDRKAFLLDLPRLLRPGVEGPEPAARDRALSLDLSRLLGPETAPGVLSAGEGLDPFRFKARDFSFHSRPFLKIQDGCDHACSYCRVSLARGPNRSLDAETLLARLRELEAAGHGEAVLTGVNLNQYRSAGLDLGGVLDYLLAHTRTIALRLSSLEPAGVEESLLRVLSSPRIRPHFHLSIQSGSAHILERMRRPYTPAAVAAFIRRLRELREDPFLACDIIAGFPGETPAEFAETYEFCRNARFAWIHAFPFSRRPGTEAWDFPDNVPEREAAGRVDSLLDLARQGKAAYVNAWAGKTVEAIVEAGNKVDFLTALSENYLKLRLPLPPGRQPPPQGTVIGCRILGAPEPAAPLFDAAAELDPAPHP
ncbi:MAG: tRNA (N(6)-L-threonylcarbamoyladenosine(37)-C(2))-methylthiotransferase MtaB [Treponema sp.]|jgi:threonylcarbamoyladenosine tRNA methylthiotransferase MtaB|nr:tRNA (N(6)-L-threonylcarbamoyladenosine(37)-C(2))-methylthiotransferase MtaB [Treponema sp.]